MPWLNATEKHITKTIMCNYVYIFMSIGYDMSKYLYMWMDVPTICLIISYKKKKTMNKK